MELMQTLNQHLTPMQIQGITLLQMSTAEVEAYIQELAQENPVIEIAEHHYKPVMEHKLSELPTWSRDSLPQNQYDTFIEADYFDPLSHASNEGGLEETLQNFLLHQLHQLQVDQQLTTLAEYLIFCLDDDGYFRMDPAELSNELNISIEQINIALKLIRSLEPAGVGADSLSQCLVLQLQRQSRTGLVLDIVQNHLDALAKHHYRAIADQLGVSQAFVQKAMQDILALDPKPGSHFTKATEPIYIHPDLICEKNGCKYDVKLYLENHHYMRLSNYYQKLLSETTDQTVKTYLLEKVQQANNVCSALQKREETLLHCGRIIVEHQQDFFRYGPHALVSMQMTDIAREMKLHVSTVSRAIKKKYIQCDYGLLPLRYFFTTPIGKSAQRSAMGTTAAKELLQSLIQGEDALHPLSDQILAQKMNEFGCCLSRRMIAKYREEMGIPSTYGRKAKT